MVPDCRLRSKKRYRTEKEANRGRMNLWGSDPTADLSDLHVYLCPVCNFYHVGHKSKYREDYDQGEQNNVNKA